MKHLQSKEEIRAKLDFMVQCIITFNRQIRLQKMYGGTHSLEIIFRTFVSVFHLTRYKYDSSEGDNKEFIEIVHELEHTVNRINIEIQQQAINSPSLPEHEMIKVEQRIIKEGVDRLTDYVYAIYNR